MPATAFDPDRGGAGAVGPLPRNDLAPCLPAPDPGWSDRDRADLAQSFLRARRRRDELIPGLFCDPAWDMLLDLYVARARRRRVSVSDACIASCAPPTTALRYLARLERRGLVIRLQDSQDARRRFLRLTDQAWEQMTAWFLTCSGSLQRVGRSNGG